MSGAFNVEQLAQSRLGECRWLKVHGPFNSRAEAEMIAGRVHDRTGQMTRVVPAPGPPEAALDHLFEGRPCRIIERPRHPSPGHGRLTTVRVEFADGSQDSVSRFSLRKVRP